MKENIILLSAIILFICGCNKSEFLDKKPDQKLVVPKTLYDLQAILDNDAQMNGIPNGLGLVPHLGETGADNYYLLDVTFNTNITDPLMRSYYLWNKDVTTSEDVPDWSRPYLCVFYANIVLEGLKNIHKTNENIEDYNRVMGSALFYRAHAFFQVAQIFSAPYFESTAGSTLGIPLRLKADVGEKITRSSVKDTYAQILLDLKLASTLLPIANVYKERPSKQAAFGLLSRTYLSMMNYENSRIYSDSCLLIKNTLMDYNDLKQTDNFPFASSKIKDQEIIFNSVMITQNPQTPIRTLRAKIDPQLYNQYSNGDLRKTIFYRTASPSGYRYKGSYLGQESNFSGLAVDEILLMRAECNVRTGRLQNGLDDINRLLLARWDKNKKYIPFVTNDKENALDFILNERRKELVFRGLRWTDIRRLNLEGRSINQERNINGSKYILLANDPRYVYPIPLSVIGFNPEMPQNIR